MISLDTRDELLLLLPQGGSLVIDEHASSVQLTPMV